LIVRFASYPPVPGGSVGRTRPASILGVTRVGWSDVSDPIFFAALRAAGWSVGHVRLGSEDGGAK
jgi:hypothetical protein